MSELRYLYRVLINPDVYDDSEDMGFYHVPWATSDEDAIAQTVAECLLHNETYETFEYKLWLCERDENVPPRQS